MKLPQWLDPESTHMTVNPLIFEALIFLIQKQECECDKDKCTRCFLIAKIKGEKEQQQK